MRSGSVFANFLGTKLYFLWFLARTLLPGLNEIPGSFGLFLVFIKRHWKPEIGISALIDIFILFLSAAA